MKLLDLPDELLSPIILEAMWATITKPSAAPDLLMHERRLTNHPSIERKKVAFVGQICGKLRRIAQPHLKPSQQWHDPDNRVELDKSRQPVVVDAPTSLMEPTIKAIAFGRGQAGFLPQLPSATLEHLSDLFITVARREVLVNYSDQVLSSIGSYKQLQHLSIHLAIGSASGIAKLFTELASIPTLQSLAMEEVYNDTRSTRPVSLALGQTWSTPLVRLEVVYCAVALPMFVELMGKVAVTLQVAIFFHTDYRTYWTSDLTTAVVGSFPHLWRLDIGFGLAAHPRNRFATFDSTPAGRRQLAECSPIAVWKAAPRLEYFDCTEQIVVKTQRELDEVRDLRKRDDMKRLRVKLETWEGDKGAGWSTDKSQELLVG